MCADATYFVIEHAEGGELFDFVLEDFQNDTSSESVAKVQFFQILSGLAHLHGQGSLQKGNIGRASFGGKKTIEFNFCKLSRIFGKTS